MAKTEQALVPHPPLPLTLMNDLEASLTMMVWTPEHAEHGDLDGGSSAGNDDLQA